MKIISFIFLFLSLYCYSNCQEIYIPPNSSVYVHKDTMSIFDNIVNHGQLGSNIGTTINFMGILWSNSKFAIFTDEKSFPNGQLDTINFIGIGGTVWFHSFSKSLNIPQFLDGGFSLSSKQGALFANINIDNEKGVFLVGNSDTKIRNKLHFIKGKLWLNDRNIIIGNNLSQGDITGFDENKFIVTGQSTKGGFLFRTYFGNSSDKIVFPYGATDSFYTPLSLSYSGNSQFFKSRVFNNVYKYVDSGPILKSKYVQSTWSISKENYERGNYRIEIQHPKQIEDTLFSANRDFSFISQYDKSRNVWDTILPIGLPLVGNITAGPIISNSFVNERTFYNEYLNNEILTKSVVVFQKYKAEMAIEKLVDRIMPQQNGTYNIKYQIVIKNVGEGELSNISVSDNLKIAFPSGVDLTILALTASGTLNINSNFLMGRDTMLILPTSKLKEKVSDTIFLLINVNTHQLSGNYVNTVFGNAKSFLSNTDVPTVVSRISVTLFPLTLHIPAGFSPDGDGINDKFEIKNALNYNITMEIFNRWGVVVYKSNGYYYNDWDGTCNQNNPFMKDKLPSGTYFYRIRAVDKSNGVISDFTSSITLRR